MKIFIDFKFEFYEVVIKFEGGLLIELLDIFILLFDVKCYVNILLVGYKVFFIKMNNEIFLIGYI